MPTPVARRIFTWRADTGEGAPFLWNDLSPAQQAALNQRSDGVVDGLGQARLNYLRGVRAQEQPGGPFRTRQRILGDIVNSNPWFVGAQNFGYEDLAEGADYQAFRLANQNRRRMLYVGANDGMLHAFDADSGQEQFAFVPATVFPMLTRLTDPGYSHRYFVDGSPVAGHVHIGGQWRTVLVGSLGAGGRAVYALDVTDPDAFNEDSILWEFTHPDLGFVLGQPSIVRLHNGRWAAIFGSGYEAGRAARLFVVDIADGSLIRVISTVRSQDEASTVTDNGLSQPFPADLTQNRIVDAVYAGDLYGNLWKFDLCGSNNLNQCSGNTTSWGVEYSQGGRPAPLITVCASGDVADPFACPATARQPITMRPLVSLGPDSAATVFFGTGKFFEITDRIVSDTDPVQSVYGVHDTGTRVNGRSQLRRQSIMFEGPLHPDSPHNLRVLSNEILEENHRGWYIDLLSPVRGFQGERAVANPRLRGGRLIFTTMYPLADPCLGGGEGWLFEINAATGGRFDFSVFDINEDGSPDDGDFVEVEIDGEMVMVPVSAIQFGFIPTTPAIIEAGAVEYKIISGSTGELETIRERGLETKGRQSWRQIFP
ncbi:MAG TPA: PilC/PilY family type IV pilus protein [Xanthomonadaceae bacterium]|nr:PilC/PilY family type IV pilus protein [Xanthomonadaceae bacterium]